MIGFETYNHQGPGIFLTRLRQILENRGLFSETEPDVWIQLSFKELPPNILQRKHRGKTKILVRMDGCYCSRVYKIRKPTVIPIPFLDDWYSAKINRKKNQKIRENLLASDGIIFQSHFSHWLTQRFVTRTAPGSIIYNGVDLNLFSPQGEQKSIRQANKLNILVSHSFRPYHRLYDCLKILARLLRNEPQGFHLHILGGDEGQTFEQARQLAQHLGLKEGEAVWKDGQVMLREGSDFTFHGKQPADELPSFYRACDLMLNLSYWDTCPNVVIEAMACGLPVAGVNHGGVAELLGTDGGIRVNERIPHTWIDHQNIHKMPQAPIEHYVAAILKIRDQLPLFSANARTMTENRFNIENVCSAYQDAALSLIERF